MEEIINLTMSYWERHGATFLKNSGSSVKVELDGDDGYYWFSESPYILRHNDKWKSIDAFQEISRLPKHKKLYQQKSETDMRELINRDEKHLYQITVNTQNLTPHYEEVTNFLSNYNILKISSPMATRKSNVLAEVIKQSHNKGLKVLIITNRVSLANDAHGKYPNLKHYQRHEYKRGDSLVVQFDSLHYYNPDDFDVVIMDEITSLLLYMAQGYEGKEEIYRDNVNFFMSLNKKKLVMSDAFIIDYPFTGKSLGIYNEFREELDVTEYKDKHTFWSKIIREASRGPISVSSNEKRVLRKIKAQLEKRGLKVLTLTADTRGDVKQHIYKMLEKEHIKYDAFLYSPTLTVGVSIFAKMENHFHYDISGTVSVVDSIQMIRRSRNAKNIHIYLQGRVSYKDTIIKNIERNLSLFKMINQHGVEFGVTDAGKKLAVVKQMRNVFDNTHRYAFKALLYYQFKKINNNDIVGEKFKL